MKDFVQIPEYPEYYINKNGEVYSTKSNKMLTVVRNPGGYHNVRFYKNKKQKNHTLHRILARVFLNLPSLTSELEVDHIDGDIDNNDVSNLQVLTKEEHRIKTTNDRNQKHWERNKKCSNCGKDILAKASHCQSCSSHKRKNDSITFDDIEYMVKLYGWLQASKKLSYSDNGLRKLYRSLSGNDPKTLQKVK